MIPREWARASAVEGIERPKVKQSSALGWKSAAARRVHGRLPTARRILELNMGTKMGDPQTRVSQSRMRPLSGSARRESARISGESRAARARAPWVKVGTVLLCGVSATLVGYYFAREREDLAARAAFESRVQTASSDLFRHFELPLEVGLSLPAFMTVFPNATAQEFGRFVAPALERHSSLAALEWAPKVTRSARAEFERDLGEIWELDGEGRRIRSPDRDVFYPLAFMAPDIPTVRGLDIAFDEERRAMVQRAGSGGRAALSPPFRLVEDPPNVMSVSILAPVSSRVPAANWEERTLGLTVCLFRLQPLVDEAFRATNLEGLSYALSDVTDPGKPLLLTKSGEFEAALDRPFEWESSVRFVDRTWRIQWRGEPALALGPSTSGWVFGLGLVLSFVLAGATFSLLALRRARARALEADRLGSYALKRRLGAGGMGVVYEAEHALLRRSAAIKLIRQDAASDLSLERFEREVQATSRLTHPNTVQVFDYGRTPSGVFYYAMEFIDGVTLRELVEGAGPVPPERAKQLIRQAAGALAEAHALGMIHRDLKPDNIMVCERGGIHDYVKVLDFGLVKNRAMADQTFITKEHAMIGTPEYMAPEAFLGGADLTPASDIYGLGSVLYFLLTGRPPHSAPSLMALVARVTTAEVPPPETALGAPIQKELSALTMACLSRAPEARPPDARELLRLLDELPASEPAWTQEAARRYWDEWMPRFRERARERDDGRLSETKRLAVGAERL